MSLTIGLTGMDPATEAALRSALMAANERLNSHWRLVSEAEAAHIIVDMDSMYGPMSWLRLHAAGKQVIGLTSAARTQADFHLGRPFDEASAAALLAEIAAKANVDLSVPRAPANSAPAASSGPASPTANSDALATAAVSQTPPATAAPVPTPAATVPAAAAAPEPEPTPVAAVAPAAEPPPATREAESVPVPEPDAQPQPEPEPAPTPPPPRELTLADWLSPGRLPMRVRLRRDAAPPLLIDTASGQYHGPPSLKPLAACFEGPLQHSDFEELDAATWDREAAAAGPVQSLTRLLWLGGLLAGKGKLLPGLDPEGRYQLSKWPQTEREYPRHFRIATAMMKGPATLPEIATASGVPVEDVADFVNANLATGFAEFVPEPPPTPAEPPKPAGLFSRLRSK